MKYKIDTTVLPRCFVCNKIVLGGEHICAACAIKRTLTQAEQTNKNKTERLIDANTLCNSLFPLGDKDALDIFRIINAAPTIKTERHGQWAYEETIAGMRYFRCTSCEKIDKGSECIGDENEISWWTFCPKCGAVMDKGIKNE